MSLINLALEKLNKFHRKIIFIDSRVRIFIFILKQHLLIKEKQKAEHE